MEDNEAWSILWNKVAQDLPLLLRFFLTALQNILLEMAGAEVLSLHKRELRCERSSVRCSSITFSFRIFGFIGGGRDR